MSIAAVWMAGAQKGSSQGQPDSLHDNTTQDTIQHHASMLPNTTWQKRKQILSLYDDREQPFHPSITPVLCIDL